MAETFQISWDSYCSVKLIGRILQFVNKNAVVIYLSGYSPYSRLRP